MATNETDRPLIVFLTDAEVALALVQFATPIAMRMVDGPASVRASEVVQIVEGDDSGQFAAIVEFDVGGVDGDDQRQVGGG
jgi:hypothetical protein